MVKVEWTKCIEEMKWVVETQSLGSELKASAKILFGAFLDSLGEFNVGGGAIETQSAPPPRKARTT